MRKTGWLGYEGTHKEEVEGKTRCVKTEPDGRGPTWMPGEVMYTC